MAKRHGWVGTVSFLILAVLFIVGYAASTGEMPGILVAVKAGLAIGFLNLFVAGIIRAILTSGTPSPRPPR